MTQGPTHTLNAGIDLRITAEDLRYTRRRYLHKERMRAAIAQVVNALLRARLESIWDATTSTCVSDSKNTMPSIKTS